MEIFAFVILMLGVIGFIKYFLYLKIGKDGYWVVVKNQTNKEIPGLFLDYEDITISSDVNIPSIPPGKKYKFNVTPTEGFEENPMKLHYLDHKELLHTIDDVGYFPKKGNPKKAIINLLSFDENGEIKLEVVQNT